MRSGRGKIRLNDAVKILRSGSLDQDGIIGLLDEFGMDERLIKVLEHKLKEPEFHRVRDIVRGLDLLPTESFEVASKMSVMTSKDVMVMMMSLRLSRPEIIWALKCDLINDDDLITVIKNSCTPELVRIIMRWRARLIKNDGILPIALRYVTQSEINRAWDDTNDNQKFKFLT